MRIQFTVLFSCVSLSLSLLACFASGQDTNSNWAQFRGPDGNGVSETAKPPISWSATSENLKWKVEIPGDSNSSPIIWGDKIIVMTAVDTGKTADGTAVPKPEASAQPRGGGGRRGGRGGGGREAAPASVHEFWVMCLNRADGSVAWKTKLNEAVPHEGTHGTNTFCSSSPVTDGKHIFASFGSFGLYCLDMKGEKVWEKDLGKMTMRGTFGEGASPALYENTLVVVADQEGQSYIESLNATTGESNWRKDRDSLSGWATPRIVKHNDKVQVIVNASTVKSYDLADGSVIWECGGQTDNPIPTPMILGDFTICMTGWRESACYAISLDSKGDVSGSSNVKWNSRDIGPYVPTGVLYKGTLYGSKSSTAVITALNAQTGEVVFPTARLEGLDTLYAAMVAANDHIYATGRNGTTLVLKHGNTLDVVATNELGEEVDATPALVDNQIFIRGSKHLFCFEDK